MFMLRKDKIRVCVCVPFHFFFFDSSSSGRTDHSINTWMEMETSGGVDPIGQPETVIYRTVEQAMRSDDDNDDDDDDKAQLQ